MVARPVLFCNEKGVYKGGGIVVYSQRQVSKPCPSAERFCVRSANAKIGCSLNKKWRKIEHEKILYP